MITPRFIVVGARDVRGRFTRKAATLPKEIEGSLDVHAALLLGELQRRSPRDTGEYAASWAVEKSGHQRIVGNPSAQARRLEYGFVGTDALGRNYNQAPQPHVRPAADAIDNLYTNDMIIVASRYL